MRWKRTRRGVMVCNPCVPWAGSLSWFVSCVSAPMFASVTTDWIVAICATVVTIIEIAKNVSSWKAAPGSPSAKQASAPEPQTKAHNSSVLRLFFNTEALPFLALFAVSVWRLYALLSNVAPPSRLHVFWISVFTGIPFVCLVYFTIQIVLFVIITRQKK